MITLWRRTWSKHAHRLHVAGDASDDRTGAVRIIESEAQPLELLVDLGAQIDDKLLLHELVDRDGVDVVEYRAYERETQNQSRQQPEHLQRRPGLGQREMQSVGAHRRALELVLDVINADARQAEAGDTECQQYHLNAEHLQAVPAVAPSQTEQAPDQHPVGGCRRSVRRGLARSGHEVGTVSPRGAPALNILPASSSRHLEIRAAKAGSRNLPDGWCATFPTLAWAFSPG